MGTIGRVKRIIRANVNDMISKAENPSKAMGLMLEEMRGTISNVKSLIAGALTDLKKAEREANEHNQQAKVWEERAVLAVKREREDLAKQALARKKTLLDKEASYREQITTQREKIESLKESLKTLEAKMTDLRQQHARLEVQQEYAKKRPPTRVRPITEPVIPVLDTSAFDAYDRMVDKVEEIEALSEAIAEMAGEDELERQFEELEVEDEVDMALEALKAKIASEDG